MIREPQRHETNIQEEEDKKGKELN